MSDAPFEYNMPLEDLPRICHAVEQAEERILRTNGAISRIGEAGILTDHVLLGPVICFSPPRAIVRHLVSPTFTRSAIDSHHGLGVVVFNADLCPFPRVTEAWDLVPAHEDDRFILFSRCPLVQKFVLADRHLSHLRHLMSVMESLVCGQKPQSCPIQEFIMSEGKSTPTPVSAEEHETALNELLQLLARLLAKRYLKESGPDQDPRFSREK